MSVPMRDENRYSRPRARNDPDGSAITDRRNFAATGASILLVVIGAILYFAGTKVSGDYLGAVGVVLMIAGGLGLVVSDLVLARARRARDGATAGHRRTRAQAGTSFLQRSDR